MPPRRGSRRTNINSITHYGIMGGLAPKSNVPTSVKRFMSLHGSSTQPIPSKPFLGLKYMKGFNPLGKYLLSKNPQCSGGIGRMAKVYSRGTYSTSLPKTVLQKKQFNNALFGALKNTHVLNINTLQSDNDHCVIIKTDKTNPELAILEGNYETLIYKDQDDPTITGIYLKGTDTNNEIIHVIVINWKYDQDTNTFSESGSPNAVFSYYDLSGILNNIEGTHKYTYENTDPNVLFSRIYNNDQTKLFAYTLFYTNNTIDAKDIWFYNSTINGPFSNYNPSMGLTLDSMPHLIKTQYTINTDITTSSCS